MGGEEDGPALGTHLPDEVVHRAGGFGVQACCRLVEKNNLRLMMRRLGAAQGDAKSLRLKNGLTTVTSKEKSNMPLSAMSIAGGREEWVSGG